MKGKLIALILAVCGVIASASVIIWSISSDINDSSELDTSSTNEAEESVTSSEPSEEDVVTTTSAPSEKKETQTTKVTVKDKKNKEETGREFTVNILLAPYGYNVKGDYVLEIAKSKDVKSRPTSHLDSNDNVFYSAEVVNGAAKIKLENGDYTVCIYPENEPDNFNRYNWKVNKDTTDKELQLIVTEKLKAGQMMIVLLWREKPEDIDGYLVGEGEKIDYWYREGWNTPRDNDSRKGNGIEAITVDDTSSKYTYIVNNFSREVSMGKYSKARVLVFTEETKAPTVFEIPESIENVWEVFSMTDGIIKKINKEGSPIEPIM